MINLIVLILLLFNCQFISSQDSNWEICNCPNLTPQSRIVNGTVVNENDLPYVGSLFKYYMPKKKNDSWLIKFHFCTGELIADKWVLTAAHCVSEFMDKSSDDYSFYFAVDGGHDLDKIYYDPNRKRECKNRYKHDLFKDGEKHNDIALIELVKPFVLGKEFGIYLACLVDSNVNFRDTTLIAAGYGKTKPRRAKESSRAITPDGIKAPSLKLLMTTVIDFYQLCRDIYKNQICVRSQYASMCMGDSGGPLLQFIKNRLYVIAVFSRVFPSYTAKGKLYRCLPGSMSIPTLIYEYIPFIKRHLSSTQSRHCILDRSVIS